MTGEGERVAHVLGHGEKSKVSLSAGVCDFTLCATYNVNPGDRAARLPHPYGGGEAESAAAAEDAVWKGETSPSVCLSVCLGVQGCLCGGGGSAQAFLCVLIAHVAQENDRGSEGCPHFTSFLRNSSQAPHWPSHSFLHRPRWRRMPGL